MSNRMAPTALTVRRRQTDEPSDATGTIGSWHREPASNEVQRLAARGVLTMSPQRGARVAAVSVAEARELYELRIQLEPQALRSAIAHSDALYVDTVRSSYDAMVEMWDRPPSNAPTTFDAYSLHLTFHEATFARCTSHWLLHLVGVLMDQSIRYVRYGFNPTFARLDEHAALVDRIVADDVEGAVASLTAHLGKSAEHLEVALA
jgi:DNA-binding GntR family transcriptional regulator